MAASKARVLIVGAGGVGTMAAYALETGGRAAVTLVLRSNYATVEKQGFSIDSIEHGHDITGWRPTELRNSIPNVAKEGLAPFDFVLVTTKNIPDVPPTIADIIEPAVTPGKTSIVLSQNGLNIEKPIIPRFPQNPIISSVSLIGATERSHGVIFHDDEDAQKIGPFACPGVSAGACEAAARQYIDIYNGSGRLNIQYEANVQWVRWRKLVYNASYNSVATVLRMDTARMRMSQHVIEDLIRPIMLEVVAAASAAGYDLPSDLPDTLIRADPTDTFFKPSMCQDVEKGNYMEIENIVHEPLKEGESRGVAMPTLRTIYGLLKGCQLKVKEARGAWEPNWTADNPYK